MITKEEATKYVIDISKKYFEPIIVWCGLVIGWIKKLFWIVKNYDRNLGWVAHQLHIVKGDMEDQEETLSWFQKQICEAKDMIKDRTEIHADICLHENERYRNSIIVIGRYRKNDYIEIFDMPVQDFEYMVNRLKEKKKWGNMAVVDAPSGIKAVLVDELKKDW